MAAKNIKALQILNQKIKNREIDKYYLAQVHGIIDPKQGTLRDYLTKLEDNKVVKVTKKPIKDNSQEIITEYKTISHDAKTSLLEVKLVTGKTHQIRAHFAFIGHPLVGEKKYTTEKYSKLNKHEFQNLRAYKITFGFTTDASILNYLKNKTLEIK
jgi:23S rRNA pseudouridine955/2504/2580 synthase